METGTDKDVIRVDRNRINGDRDREGCDQSRKGQDQGSRVGFASDTMNLLIKR